SDLIASRIDRSIHPPGLFRGHVGECSGDGLGRLGSLALARKPRGESETREPHFAVVRIYQDVGRLDVLVHEPALLGLTQRRRDADGQARQLARLHGHAPHKTRSPSSDNTCSPARAFMMTKME